MKNKRRINLISKGRLVNLAAATGILPKLWIELCIAGSLHKAHNG
jgi:S-adenosylhomocysteine hydrolase